MAVRTVIGLRAALCVVVVTLCWRRGAVAEDAASAAGFAAERRRTRRPAMQTSRPQKPAETAAETDTREAMCLMIEVGGEGERPAAGVFRARDLAGKPVSIRCGRTGHAQRPARAGHRAIHAGHRQRAAAARSVRSRAGAAEIGRVPERAAPPVRQSRAGRGRLQCRTAAGAGMARRHRPACRRRRATTSLAITGSSVDDWAGSGSSGKMPERAPHVELPRADGVAASARPIRSSPNSNSV